jgi:hypothetical protein
VIANLDSTLEIRYERIVVCEVMSVERRQQGDDHHEEKDTEGGHRGTVSAQLSQ